MYDKTEYFTSTIGYANGSRGKMIGILPEEGNVLPPGAPEEMMKIEPPKYVIMIYGDQS